MTQVCMIHSQHHSLTKYWKDSEDKSSIHSQTYFSRDHQIRIAKEDRHKTTFLTKWGCFKYMVMDFGLKNAPTIFSRIVVVALKGFIHKFLAVYMEYWTIYVLVKYHTTNLRLMLERCRQHYISLKLKKCVVRAPFGILLGHIV